MVAFTERQSPRYVNGRLRARVNRPIIKPPSTKVNSLHFAGFWMRLWAYLLDALVVLSINGLVSFPLRLIGVNDLIFSPYMLLSASVFFLYFALMTKYYGQTLGKMVLGLKVISTNGSDLTWTQVIFREGVGRLIHQLFFMLRVIYLFIAFTTKKQGLHDLIADTYVVFEKSDLLDTNK
ncbi:RDD family protein [Bacillus suaedae]|uniref:RDD family protein n=1 Tax=Halalkalibacter suaedae TaxID=2822140 RepID=A0A940WP30_9BACI|nr:RDD family protein [Bacillus suaedae]MBP3949771.1 RDD family protein [Bacillus suaedae]